jgi:Tol biopolymer transport system component
MADDQSIGVWSPDSTRVAFGSGFSGRGQLFIRSADGNGAPESLIFGGDGKRGPGRLSYANTWTPDGASLVVWSVRDDGAGLWLLPLKENAEARLLFADPTGALEADFSSDGRWLAYSSGGFGRNEVYVRPYPALDRREQVAGQNSRAPLWRRDGRELFYLQDAPGDTGLNVRVMAVPVTTTPTFSVGAAHVLFEGPFRRDGPFRPYDVTADGQRFLMVRAVEQPPARVSQMVLVQNWTEELRARAPAK